MADPQVRFEELVARLREHDHRLTPQRLTLLRLLAASDGHPSATQLFDQIKLQFPTMSQATVYKTLHLLKEIGEVLEIDLKEDSHYDGNKPYPHPHLICIQCRKITDGELELTQDLLREAERASGYQILRHQLDFFGYCPDCQQGFQA